MGQIEKIVSFSKRGSLTKNNGTITNVKLLMVMEKFNFFKNFHYLLTGGHDKKLKNFGKSKKKWLSSQIRQFKEENFLILQKD